jgi:hypothetical protein
LTASGANEVGVLDHDTVVWMGDLNYRIDLPYNKAAALIHNQDWEQLQQHDQV